MSLEIVSFADLQSANQVTVAGQVSSYTNAKLGEKPQMLAVTAQDVLDKFAGLVAMAGGEFAGYVGANQPEIWQNEAMSEVGTLWVPRAFRGRGIAYNLVAVISDQLVARETLPYAFCNTLSQPIFLATGYALAQCTQVPESAFSLCGECPMKPTSGCCDQPVIYAGGAK